MTEKIDQAEKTLPDVEFDEFPIPSYETWKEEATALLKGASFEKKLLTKTYEGITLSPMYTRQMSPSPEELSQLPGAENYMRGTHEGGYMTDPWKISQQCEICEPKQLNKLLLHEIEKGSTELNISLDRLTREGKGPQQLTAEDIKAGGASIATLADMHTILQGIALEKYSLYMESGAAAGAIVSLVAASLRADGQNPAVVRGTIGADPLGALAINGSVPALLPKLYDEMAATSCWCETHMPKLRNILVSGQPYSDGGASAVQELGYMLATAIVYLREMQERGLSIEQAAGRMQFSFSLGANFFMEIAKLRAARLLWSQIIESFGGSKEARKMAIHARTATFNKTKYDPYVNMLRTTTEAFSAVIGGIDSLQVSPFDECLQIPDEFSRRIARNTQIILQSECNLCQPVDPAGGSWYIETLTQQVAEKSWQIMQEVEKKGGMTAALVAGTVQSDVKDVLLQRFKKLASRADRAVGINMYANMQEQPLEIRPMDTEGIKKARLLAVEDFKADVDEQERAKKMTELQRWQGSCDSERIAGMVAAFTAGGDIGGIAEIFYPEGAQYIAECVVEKHRFTEQFEGLRNKMQAYEQKHGEKLKIFLCNMGPIPQHKPRADFSTGFLEVGGFEVLKNDGFSLPQEAVAAAVESKALAAVICSTDATYPELVPDLARRIKAENPAMIVMLAGAPAPEFEASYREAGVAEFIHVRANCLQILTWLQTQGEIE